MNIKPFTLFINHNFSAQRRLPGYAGPENSPKCAQLHTTYFKLQLEIATIEPPHQGFAIDFYQIKKELENLLDPMVGEILNDIKPFNTLTPSTENVSKWLFQQFESYIDSAVAKLLAITVWEDENFAARYAPCVL